LLAQRLLPPAFDPAQAQRFRLLDEDLGFYEPVVDIALAEATGRLCAYVQRCGTAPDSAQPLAGEAVPASLMEWVLPMQGAIPGRLPRFGGRKPG
jgi:hypothetical protein